MAAGYPSVLVECLSGRPDRTSGRVLLKTCDVRTMSEESFRVDGLASAVWSREGSAGDAIVVAAAEPGGTVCGEDIISMAVSNRRRLPRLPLHQSSTQIFHCFHRFYHSVVQIAKFVPQS